MLRMIAPRRSPKLAPRSFLFRPRAGRDGSQVPRSPPHTPPTFSLSSDLLPEKATMVKVVMHTPARPANTSLL